MVKLTTNIIVVRNMVLVWDVAKRGPDVTYNPIPRITGSDSGTLLQKFNPRYFMLPWYKRENERYSNCNLLKVKNSLGFSKK